MKTVIISDKGFGDALWSEPIVQAFLDKGHKVNLFVPYPSIFDNYPTSNLILNDVSSLFPLKEQPITLSLFADPKRHLLEVFFGQAGLAGTKLRAPRLYLTENEKERKIQHDYALIHLDHYKMPFHLPRNVYGIEWEKVMAWIRSKGLAPLQISGRETLQVAPIAPTKDWREIMSLMMHASLFIGLDSGPSHIAALMGIPSVIFFGSVNPQYRHLDDHKKVFLQNPCPYAHCYHSSTRDTIPTCRRVPAYEAPPCAIHDADKVIDAIEEVLF